jgi:hypothetical protein
MQFNRRARVIATFLRETVQQFFDWTFVVHAQLKGARASARFNCQMAVVSGKT